MSKIDLASPVVKWVGGKRQLLERLMPLFPEIYTTYCEPFIGGGAVLFALQPKKAIINDINSELIGVYRAIKNDVDALIKRLAQFENTKECFYDVRSWDRNAELYNQLTDIDKAARIKIFMYRTQCTFINNIRIFITTKRCIKLTSTIYTIQSVITSFI